MDGKTKRDRIKFQSKQADSDFTSHKECMKFLNCGCKAELVSLLLFCLFKTGLYFSLTLLFFGSLSVLGKGHVLLLMYYNFIHAYFKITTNSSYLVCVCVGGGGILALII